MPCTSSSICRKNGSAIDFSSWPLWPRKAPSTDGCSGRFDPDRPVSREELAVMLGRALDYSEQASIPAEGGSGSEPATVSSTAEDSWKDADSVSDWARDELFRLLRLNLLQGEPAGRINPGKTTSRAEAAVLLQRWLIYSGWIQPPGGLTTTGMQ